MPAFNIPRPELQISFAFALGQIRKLYLQDALSETVGEVEVAELDRELAEYVPSQQLKALAKHGLRAELVFPAPCLLTQSPRLLGYYRLLLGFNQKQFYSTAFGIADFKAMEIDGQLSEDQKPLLAELCRALIESAGFLLDGLGVGRISRQLLDDLTLLTLGPELRESRHRV